MSIKYVLQKVSILSCILSNIGFLLFIEGIMSIVIFLFMGIGIFSIQNREISLEFLLFIVGMLAFFFILLKAKKFLGKMITETFNFNRTLFGYLFTNEYVEPKDIPDEESDEYDEDKLLIDPSSIRDALDSNVIGVTYKLGYMLALQICGLVGVSFIIYFNVSELTYLPFIAHFLTIVALILIGRYKDT